MIEQLVEKFHQKVLLKNYMTSPVWIELSLNNICNQGCKMNDVCTKNFEFNLVKNLIGLHPLNMPFDLIKRIIDQTATYYQKANLGSAFTEPLVYPYIKESIVRISVVFKQ